MQFKIVLPKNMIADITKYAALIRNEKGEILFARKYGKTTWLNVGGRIEKGETPIECLKREIKEELSSDIKPKKKYVRILETPATPALDDPNKTVQIIWYEIELENEPIASSEIEEIKWIDINNVDVEISPQIKEFLIPFLQRNTN